MGDKPSMPRRRLWPFPVAALVIGVIPLLAMSDYQISVLVFIGIYTILALGLNLLMGYAGQVSLGHAAFYGIGAYTSAILTTRLGLSPWLGLAASAVAAGLVAYLIGKPALKLRGHYLAMATLGFGIVVQIVFNEYSPLTGGTSGISGIPELSLFGFRLGDDRPYYYLVWLFVLILMWVSSNIVESRIGRALRSVHGSEAAAASVGVDTAKYKVQVFVLSGVYAGLAGGLYAHYLCYVNPGPFGFMFSIELLIMVVVGGMASIWGAIAGATAINLLSEGLHRFEEYEVIVFGLILVLVMIYLPMGLTKAAVDLVGRWKDSRASSRGKE